MDNLRWVFSYIAVLSCSSYALNVTSKTDYVHKDDIRKMLVQIDKLQNVTASLEHRVILLEQENDNLRNENEQSISALSEELFVLKSRKCCLTDQEMVHNISVIKNDISSLNESVLSNEKSLTIFREDLINMTKEIIGLQNKTEMVSSLHTTINKGIMKDNPIGFTAFNSIAINNLRDYQSIVFDKIVSQYGSGYDPSRGIFTAQRAGLYVFFADIRTQGKSVLCWIDLVKDGNPLGTIFFRTTGSSKSSDSTLVVVDLASGEKIWIRKRRYTFNDGDPCALDDNNTFSGFLLVSK